MYQQLISYGESDVYPFHMPGHKRRALPFPNPYTIDITEIDGFDNLHHAEGLIREAEERAAKLYGADRSYYLVNGSTCGLLAAICAAARRGDKVLAARNCHKAVYHAVSMQGLAVEFLYPAITRGDLQGQITAAQVEEALTKHPDIAVVILTSPTYEGIVSDVAAIAACCHAHGAALIVDEAHGAHFGFGAGFPENAVRLGADAVIMSLHKTLPSFTQTALLHCNGTRIDPGRVARYLGVYETSSPSYLFMAGMDACIDLIREQGAELFAEYRRRLDAFYRDTADLTQLHVMRREDLCKEEAYDWDDSKLIIYAGTMGGEALHQELLGHYHLQMEMAAGSYVLAMTAVGDTKEGFDRLRDALFAIDAQVLEGRWKDMPIRKRVCGRLPAAEMVYTSYELEALLENAKAHGVQFVPWQKAAGYISTEYAYLYPPGIPLIVPGERITEEIADMCAAYHTLGFTIEGLKGEEGYIEVLENG